MVSNKIQIISCIISVASIFISYFLGRLESKRKYISSVKKDRYYDLYSPYIELLNSLEIEGIDLFVEFPSMKILRKRIYYSFKNSIKVFRWENFKLLLWFCKNIYWL